MTPDVALLVATLATGWWSHHEYVVERSAIGGALWAAASIFLAGLFGYAMECTLCLPAA